MEIREEILDYYRGRVLNMIELGFLADNTDVESYVRTYALIKEEEEEKNKISDSKIEYDDEIVEIEFLGDRETVDVTVTGDSLFYCNGILTKNSFGISATADLMYALIANEDLIPQNLILVKQLKNRYGDKNEVPRFFLTFDRLKMNFKDAPDPTKGLYDDEEGERQARAVSVPDKFDSSAEASKKDFSDFKF